MYTRKLFKTSSLNSIEDNNIKSKNAKKIRLLYCIHDTMLM